MKSPRGKAIIEIPSPKQSSAKEKELSSNSRRLIGFKSKNMSDLRSVSPDSKRSNSTFSKHEKSFSTLYSKLMQHKIYEENHERGYTADQIQQAVDYIFKKYDSNHDNFLDKGEVKKLIQNSLLHMGQKHVSSELEIIKFINSMDNNSDGKLSRQELENAFKRANRIQY